MSTALQTIEQSNGELTAPLRPADVRAQVNLIQEVMRDVMQGPARDEKGREIPGVHYGLVPGCGDKPTLLQPGAHKLCLTFRLVPDPEMTIIQMERGHREVRCKVKLYNQRGVFLGAGVGVCSTMEGKYRFRTGPVEFTDKPVPKQYWDLRNSDPAKAKAMLGEGMIAKKNDAGAWVCARQGEKVEHDNPADYYNTVEKMAYKRALVSATLTVTAASDIFTQDIEDMPEVIPGATPTQSPAQTAQPTQTATTSTPKDKASDVLSKMQKPAPTPAAPAPSAAHQGDASGPVTGGTAAGEQPQYDAEWISEVIDYEDKLRATAAGTGTLRSIRTGFNLTDGTYPMLPEQQVEYHKMVKTAWERMKAAK